MKYNAKGMTAIHVSWGKEISYINRILLFFLLICLFSACGGKKEYKLIEAGYYYNGELMSRNIYDGALIIDDDNIYIKVNGEEKTRVNIIDKKFSIGETKYKLLDSEGNIGTLIIKWFDNKVEGTDNGNNFYYIIK